MKVLISILIGLLVVGCGGKGIEIANPKVEKGIRSELNKWEGKLTEADLEKITFLSLSTRFLTDLNGEDLQNLTQLKELNIRLNQLTKFPEGLEKLAQLEALNLGYNNLTDLTGLEKLTKLKELYLGGNEFLFNELNDVKGLENLEKLTNLEELHIANNQLTKYPAGLEKLTKLKWLDLNLNKLKTVAGLEKLTNLEHLNLRGNQLTSVTGLEKLTKLKGLSLQGNQLTKAQIDALQKALPNCNIYSNPTK